MKKILFLAIFVIIDIALNAQEDYDNRMISAIEKMDQGQVPMAIVELKGIINDYPDLFVPRYELAYAYLMAEEKEKAYKCLKKAKKCKDKTDQWYQLMGTLEDYMGKPDKCIKTFKKGLKEFPNSGLLLVEMGMACQSQERYDEAISYYTQGIEVAPMYPSNYFRAANLYLSSTAPIWGLMYAEMYLLIDPASKRANTMSEILSNYMKQAVNITDTSISMYLGKHFNITFDTTTHSMKMPFEVIYSLCNDYSQIPVLIKGKKNIDIEVLTLMHRMLMEKFTKPNNETEGSDWSTRTGDILFPYLKRIDQAGFFDLYCHIIYRGMGDEEYDWIAEHSTEVEDFFEWMKSNPFVITPENAFTIHTAKNFNLLGEDTK